MKNQLTAGAPQSKKLRFMASALTLLLVLGLPLFPLSVDRVSAAENTSIKVEQTGGYFAVQGDVNVPLKVRVTNSSSAEVAFSASTNLKATTGDLMEPKPSGGTITLPAGQSAELVFSINVASNADVGSHSITVLLIDRGSASGDVLRSKTVSIQVSQKTTTEPAEYPGNYFAAADLVHSISPGDAIQSGVVNQLTLSFSNKGNTAMKDAKITLTLPDGLSLSNSSSTLSVGYVAIGSSKTVVYPITADSDLTSKNYPVTVAIDFYDKENSAKTITQTLYIPVQSGGTAAMDQIVITGISAPDQVASGKDFTLNFRVANQGAYEVKQIKIEVDTPDGLVNRTKNVFLESSLAPGESKSYSVTLFSKGGAEEKSYLIPIVAAPASGTGDSNQVTQYTSVFVKNLGSGSVKTPQLMVSDYSFGGTYVQAGEEFRLDLGLMNTSGSHTLQNVKVTLESTDGTFIPVGSSNSFYINEIDQGGMASHSLFLSVKPDAEQKTTSVNLSMSYEDTAGNAYTATDVISIPVMQETRLVVDDIVAPPELYTGTQNGVSVSFYNMGKTKLNNLQITAEGDFDTMESNRYFVGNMDPGTTDSYDFTFIPRATGPMVGKVIFTYEDASGDQQQLEKEFSFDIMDMPVFEEGPMPVEEPAGNGIPWLPIGIGAVVVAGGIVAFVKIRRRRKMHREMEIDE